MYRVCLLAIVLPEDVLQDHTIAQQLSGVNKLLLVGTRFAWINLRQMALQAAYGPGGFAFDGQVLALLIGRLHDQCYIHDGVVWLFSTLAPGSKKASKLHRTRELILPANASVDVRPALPLCRLIEPDTELCVCVCVCLCLRLVCLRFSNVFVSFFFVFFRYSYRSASLHRIPRRCDPRRNRANGLNKSGNLLTRF